MWGSLLDSSPLPRRLLLLQPPPHQPPCPPSLVSLQVWDIHSPSVATHQGPIHITLKSPSLFPSNPNTHDPNSLRGLRPTIPHLLAKYCAVQTLLRTHPFLLPKHPQAPSLWPQTSTSSTQQWSLYTLLQIHPLSLLLPPPPHPSCWRPSGRLLLHSLPPRFPRPLCFTWTDPDT